MKTFITAILASLLLFSCKSGSNLSKEENASLIKEKIETTNYTFVPQTALPMSGRSINLNYSFSLKVTKDTIDSYLPYFGRAYRAPMSATDGGIKFTSTDFDYKISDKKKDMWEVEIEPKDTPTKYKLSLSIGSTGYATLTVLDVNRQSITFHGKIE